MMYIRDLFFMSAVGLDVQPDAVRLVRLQKNWHGVTFCQANVIPLQPNVFKGEKIYNWEQLQAAVSEIVIMAGIQGESVVAGLTAASVNTGIVTLATGKDEAKVIDVIQYELGIDQEKSYIHVVPVGADKQSHQEYFYVVSPRDYLLQYMNCLEAAGIKLKIIDLDIFALQRMLRCELAAVLKPVNIERLPVLGRLIVKEEVAVKYNSSELALFTVAAGLAVRECYQYVN